jgi:CHASE2 domain-containing sensor protein
VHSSMLAQETPSPKKPGLHAHVKAPSVSVHAALVSQLLNPSAIEGRVTSSVAPRLVHWAYVIDSVFLWRSQERIR